MQKKNSMGYAKKGKEKKNIHAKKHERKKREHAKEHEEKKRKRKERNKDSPYFRIKAFIPKRERFMIKRSTKNI